MFSELYKPNTLSKVVGNKKTINNIIKWANDENKQKQIGIILGKSGIGKTLIVELLCKDYDYQTVYMDEIIDINLIQSINKFNMNGKKNLIIIEEIDTIEEKSILELVKILDNINAPILCTSNTNYISSFKNISNKIEQFKLFPPSLSEITAFLNPIIKQHKISISIPELVINCNNDIRYILNTLTFGLKNTQNLQKEKDDTSLNIFEIGKELFNMDNSFNDKYNLYYLEPNIMQLFIQENYINNVFACKNNPAKQLEYLANSASELSNSDILDYNMDWELKKYVSISAINATQNCNTKEIKFPEYFKKQKKTKNFYNSLNCMYDETKNINENKKTSLKKDTKTTKSIKVKKDTKTTKATKVKNSKIKGTKKQ
jgi:hypothetical protein